MAGVIIRSDLTAGTAEALMAITPGDGAIYQSRTTSSGTSSQVSTAGAAPGWLRLVRSGSSFTGFLSADGVHWTEEGATTITMGTTVDVGMVVTSAGANVLATATFDHVGIDTTPTVFTAAAATPNPATGTTASLSVLGSDLAGESTLNYTWTTTALPGGARTPTFAQNGTNAAKNDTVTFFAAGTYTFQATFTNQAGLSNKSSVTVTVNPTLAAISVAPALVNLSPFASEQFSATALDQFGVSLSAQPNVTWTQTAGGGSVSPGGLYTAPGSGTVAAITATSGAFSSNASVYVLSSPWITQDINAPALSGAAGDDGHGAYTVLGGGNGISGTSDQFRFAYQTLGGNGSITARVISEQDTSPLTMAGVMIRNDLTAGTAEGLMVLTPGEGALFQSRLTASGGSASTATAGLSASYWVRLVRAGNSFTGFISADGVHWTNAGSSTIAMGNTVDVGLAVTSSGANVLTAATFDNVAIDTNPTVATAAAAIPNPITGTTASLSVLGSDLAGESTLTYTWTATTLPSGAPAPTFAVNGTNAARNDGVTFQRAGNYTFTVTITNSVGLSITNSVNVTVNQAITSLMVLPVTASLIEGATESFSATAFDQFGQALASQPAFAWSVDSGGVGGTISAAGLYTTPGPGTGSDTVRAATGSFSATASVTVTAATATKLVVAPQSQPPSSVTAGMGFGLVVRAEDGFGNVDPNFSGSVALAMANNPGNAILGGTITATASAGVATFSGVLLIKAASGDTLRDQRQPDRGHNQPVYRRRRPGHAVVDHDRAIKRHRRQ